MIRTFQQMAGTSVSAYGTESGVGFLWHQMGALLRLDVAILSLLLACTLALVVRVARCYRSARHRGIDSPRGKRSVAELKSHVGNLNSIASTAPYFGLLGTCLGVLSAFSVAGVEKQVYLAWVASRMAAALVPSAAGIIVAVPATCGYEYGCTRLDLLVNGPPNPKRLLTRRFTKFPPFGIIAALLLVVLLRMYLVIAPGGTSPKGLEAGIASPHCEDLPDDLIALRISKGGRIFLNQEEEQDWRGVRNRLSEIYRMRTDRVLYFWADEGVPFQTAADAIDTVESVPENIAVRLITPTARNAPCIEPRRVRDSFRHRSR